MVKIQDGFYDLVVKCKETYAKEDDLYRKDVNDKDIWDSASFVVVLRLGGMLDEAKSNYLVNVLRSDDKLLDKDYLLSKSFLNWSERLLKLIEDKKKAESNKVKLSILNIIRPSNDPESPIRRLHDDLFNFAGYIENKPLTCKFINDSDPSKDGDLIADIKMKVRGMGFTKATIFCYEIGLGYDFSAVSAHVKDFAEAGEDYYVVNNELRKEILSDYQSKDSKISMRHIDLAVYALYVGRTQLFKKHNKSKITPKMVINWMELKRIDLNHFLKIISDLDKIELNSQDFTDFMSVRI